MRNREQPLKVCPGSVTEVLERRFPESLKDACPASHRLSSPYWKFKNEGIQTVFGSEDSYQAVCVKKCYQQTLELFPCEFLGSQTKQVNCHTQHCSDTWYRVFLQLPPLLSNGWSVSDLEKNRKTIFLNSATPACIK